MRTIALLGSTGSIGMSTLDLARRFPDRFKVDGLVAGENLKRLVSQIREFSPGLLLTVLPITAFFALNAASFFVSAVLLAGVRAEGRPRAAEDGERPQSPRRMKWMLL